MLALVYPVTTVAYGPGVHLREAQQYAASFPDWATDELLPYLYLGAFFPDIQSAGVDLGINTHNKGLADTLMALAETPWQTAFAAGYRLHIASDTAAQVFYIPWLTAQSGLFAVNLFADATLPVEADNELLIEGFGDFHSGTLDLFVDLVWDFVITEQMDLDPVLLFYLGALQTYLGPPFDFTTAQLQLETFRTQLKNQLGAFSPDGLKSIIAAAKAMSLKEFLAVVSSGALNGLLSSVPNAQGKSLVADPAEVTRLMAHPVGATPGEFFAAYDTHFTALGAQIANDPGFADWPSYHAKTIQSGILQSLTMGAPYYAHRADVLLYDAHWSQAPNPVDSDNPPPTITAWSELFLARGAPQTVVLEVWADPPLVNKGPKVLVAQTTALVTPAPARTVLSLTFDPAPYVTEASAFDMTWRFAGDPWPFLSTDYDHLASVSLAPVYKPPYVPLYGQFPPRIVISHSGPLLKDGSIRGHVTADSYHGITATVNVLGQAETTIVTNVGGAFVIEPVTPGNVLLTAAAPGFVEAELAVTVVAQQLTVVHLPLTPIPTVNTAPGCCGDPNNPDMPWLADGTWIPVHVSVAHFPITPARVELGAAPVQSEPTWVNATDESLLVRAVPTVADGMQVIVFARADGGPIAATAPVGVDSSPPPLPTLEIQEKGCPEQVDITLWGTDPHSPIVERQVRVVGHDWVSAPATLVVPTPGSQLEGRIRNAAGLWSQSTRVQICIAVPEPTPDTTSEPHDTEADATMDSSGNTPTDFASEQPELGSDDDHDNYEIGGRIETDKSASAHKKTAGGCSTAANTNPLAVIVGLSLWLAILLAWRSCCVTTSRRRSSR